VVTFPRDDAEFARSVDEQFAVVEELDCTSADKMLRLLQDLLAAYPNLEIRQQDGLASFDSEPLTWYAYRDGLTVN
jgi:hypothetical protein